MMQYRWILFDLDGTLVDNTESILEAYVHAYESIQLPYPGHELMKSLFGMTLDAIVESLQIPLDLRAQFKDRFRTYLIENGKEKPVDGVSDLLKELQKQGAKLGVVTSKIQRSARKTLHRAFPSIEFDVLITGDIVRRPKPFPDPVLQALEQLGVPESEKKNAVYVGDSKYDIQAAKQAAVTSIGVTWGVHGERLVEEEPTYLVRTTHELREILLT